MASDPRLSLQVKAPDIGQVFSNALLNVQRLSQIQQAQEARPSAQAKANKRRNEIITSLGVAGQQLLPVLQQDIQSGDFTNSSRVLDERREFLIASKLPTDQTDDARALLQSNPAELLTRSKQAVELAAQLRAQQTGGASTKAFAPQTDPQTGEVSSITFDPDTNQFARTVIPGAKQLTPQQKSEIEIKETVSKERVKLRERRTSEITAEISQRNRDAARSERTVNKALTLAQSASQGLSGASKLRLSRLVPGIDASDEAALDAATKELALEQLQAFKGPTTDFEFGVTQAIAGGIGQSQSANIARLKSLKRATWFNQREESQFRKHTKSGGDPDSFRFNFGEPIRTKKGVFTLQDLQDTAVQQTMTIDEVIKSLNK